MKRLLASIILICALACTAIANPLWPKIPQAPKPNQKGYVLWSVESTVPFFGNIPPSVSQIRRKISCVSYQGEYEPLIIGLWAQKNMGMVRLDAPSERFKITVHKVAFQDRRVPPLPAKGKRIEIPFYLPPMQEAQLRVHRNTVYWLTIYVPEDMKPGIYQEKLHLYVQEIDRTFKRDAGDTALARQRYGGRFIEIPYTVEVLPFKLPQTTTAFGVFTVGGRRPAWAWTPEYEKLCAEDMARHGMNSTTTGSWFKDTGFHVNGKVKLEGSELERRIELRIAAGLLKPDVPFFLFLCGAIEAGGLEKYVELARQLGAEFKKRGWPEPIWYGPDEPGPKAIEAAMPEAMLAIQEVARNGTALKGHTVLQYQLGKYFSVWMCNIFSFTPEVVVQAELEGKELWTYDCYHRGTNPVLHRYYAGIHTWAHRFKGNFLWAYTHTPEASWEGNRTDHRGMVSISRAGPVAMVGWEARREGIEDYRLLSYLEELAIGKDDKAVLAWLDELRSKAVYKICADEKGHFLVRYSQFFWDMTDLLNPCPAIAPEEYEGIRAKAQGYIMEMV